MARKPKKTKFTPTKGGDGGMPAEDLHARGAAKDLAGERCFSYRNTAVYLTGASPTNCIETLDPFDRAHAEKLDGRDAKLKPAARKARRGEVRIVVAESVPRMYPPAEFHQPPAGDRKHYEEVFAATFDRERALREDGLEVFEGRASFAIEKVARLSGKNFRNLVRPRTRS
ncbi:MAG: hypothetical protein KF805_12275 [Phycisphaeraceae bacterium]|nr:hypothetical protein [Phycisphaeraceae bacterium]